MTGHDYIVGIVGSSSMPILIFVDIVVKNFKSFF